MRAQDKTTRPLKLSCPCCSNNFAKIQITAQKVDQHCTNFTSFLPKSTTGTSSGVVRKTEGGEGLRNWWCGFFGSLSATMAESVAASEAEVSIRNKFYTRPKRSNGLADAFPWYLRGSRVLESAARVRDVVQQGAAGPEDVCLKARRFLRGYSIHQQHYLVWLLLLSLCV